MCQKKLRVNQFGYTPDEWIKIIPEELSFDGVSFSSIVNEFKEQYDLPLEEVVHYISLSIYELYDRGARPVKGAGSLKDSEYDWILLLKYGKSKDEIANNIIKEWAKNGYDDPVSHDFWFALVDEYCYVPEETAS